MSSNANSVKPNKASALASIRALIAGTQKHTPNGSLTFGNATYTAASLVQMLQSLVDAMSAHEAEQAKAKDVLLALHDATAKVAPVLRAYRRFLVATYGTATETLADYGLKPPKARAPQTSEQKAKAVAKLRATRKARGTTSKKKKASIHGVVTADVPPPPPASPGPKPTT
jgi:ABC-type transporter Mla subunit MlaD